MSLIDVLININLIIRILDIYISSWRFLRMKPTTHLLGETFLINLHNTFICSPSTLVICFQLLADLLVVSRVVLQLLIDKVNISVINLELGWNWIVQSYWILYFQIHKFRVIPYLNASFFENFLASFHRNDAFWTNHVVFLVQHTALSQLFELYLLFNLCFKFVWILELLFWSPLLILLNLISILKVVMHNYLIIIDENIVDNIDLSFTVVCRNIALLDSLMVSKFWAGEWFVFAYSFII